MTVPFRRIKQDISQQILSGQWEIGMQLPKEIDLAQQYQCARATVNRALRELAEEGLLIRKKKAGTIVAPRYQDQHQITLPLIRDEIEASGQHYRHFLLNKNCAPATRYQQALLSMAENDNCLSLDTLFYSDDQPYLLEQRWINLALIPMAEKVDFSSISANEWLLSKIPFKSGYLKFSAITADDHSAEIFACPPGTSLFCSKRLTRDMSGCLSYASHIFHPGYHFNLPLPAYET